MQNLKIDMFMIQEPQQLKEGSKVGILSTARKITLPEILSSIQLYSSWGLNVVVGKTISQSCNQFAGTDEQRTMDLQQMLDDKEIKSIFCARGGYGSARILDSVDFSSMKTNPKWVVGYSDVTALLMHLYYKYNVMSIHGTMPINIDDRKPCVAYESLKRVLFEGKNEINVPYNAMNICGSAAGDLIGGNLSVLYSLLGSESFGETKDKILVIEDLDEYLYHIDRMLLALKRANKLNVKALLVGQFTDLHDNDIPFGMDYKEIVVNMAKDYNIPVAFDVPIGHIGKENHAFIHGKLAKVEISAEGTNITQ